MDMRKSRVLRQMRNGKVATCTKLNLSDPRVAEIAAMCGFDCIWVDMEHIPNDYAFIENSVRAAKNFDVDELFSTSFGIYLPEGKAKTITFKTSEREAPFLRDLPLHKSQQEIGREGDKVIFSIFVCPDKNLIMEFCKYGSRIEVLSPEDVRNTVKEELKVEEKAEAEAKEEDKEGK